jgi:predicted  nucleic acid-binding Zn-ribbon protein
MRILRVYGKQVWGLEELDLRPDGKSVAITGGTKRGKTSILKAVRDGFFGTVEGTIHDGATEGSILIETDEITIERVVDSGSKTKSLKVWRGDVAVKAPQAFLEKIARALAFNPVSFYTEKPKRQREMLLSAIPMEITEEGLYDLAQRLTYGDLERETIHALVAEVAPRFDRHPLEIAADLYKVAYTTRHGLGQKVDARKELIAGLSAIPEVDYDEAAHAETKGAVERLSKAREEMGRKRSAIDSADARASTNLEQVNATKREIERLEAALAEARGRLEQQQDQQAVLVEDCEAAREEYAAAEQAFDDVAYERLSAENEAFEDLRRKRELREQTGVQRAEAEEEMRELAARHAQHDIACEFFRNKLPEELVLKAQMPVTGVTVDDERVLIHGRPLDTLSGEEALNLSIDIAAGQLDRADTVKLILIDGAERLDLDDMKALEKRAKKGDVQFFWTRVTSGPLDIRTVE